jgi:cytochrome c biogenesis protein CcdA
MSALFGLGVSVTLSLYGAIASLLGHIGLSYLHADVSDIKNWVYFFAGMFAYMFALSELGLVRFRMPTYIGTAPRIIERRRDYTKSFLLGLFFGNLGVGCPHPAMPLLLTEVASSGDVLYGSSLLFVQALGRVVPLILFSILGVLGFNGLDWLIARKEKIIETSGWGMMIISSFVMTFGLFTSAWWFTSPQYQFINKNAGIEVAQLTQIVFGTPDQYIQSDSASGIFGQPIAWGNTMLCLLWLFPLGWKYMRERRRVLFAPELRILQIEHRLDQLESERRGLEVALHIPHGRQIQHYKLLETKIDVLEKERHVHEHAARYGATPEAIRSEREQKLEEQNLRLMRNWYLTLALVVCTCLLYVLPQLNI